MAATLRAIGEPGGADAISALTSSLPAADLNAWSVACRSAISRKSCPIAGPGGAPACTAASAPSVSEAIWASEPATERSLREVRAQPDGQGIARRVGDEELVGLVLQRLDTVDEHGLDQGLPGREVAVQGARTDIGRAGDLLERGIRSPCRERCTGGFEDPVPVALCVDSHPYIMKHRSPCG